MTIRVGSLFSGYGGLDLGVMSVIGGELAWYADVCRFDKDGNAGHHTPHRAPCSIMAHHHPDIPNHGDVTTIDYSQVEPVDVLTGGFPCQDVSHAGRRAGLIRDGEGRTRSGLWGEMLRAIDELRPGLVVAENVRGLLSARADSDVEPCPWCMGDGDGEPPMRALGAVLADLADVGYDAAWYGLRAADVGAAHGRFRVFIFAWPTGAPPHPQPVPREQHGIPGGLEAPPVGGVPADGDQVRGAVARGGVVDSGREPVDPGPVHARRGLTGPLLPTPVARDHRDAGTRDRFERHVTHRAQPLGEVAVHLLPTPRTSDTNGTGAHGQGGPDLRTAVELLPTPVSDNSRGLPSSTTDYASLANVAVSLLPTPRATDGTKGGPNQRGSSGDLMLPSAAALLPTPMVGSTSPAAHGQISGDYRARMADAIASWGDYGPAIARWESVIGRPAPAPTEPGKNGNPRLSPAFVEWLMGLPEGHVTDVPGVSRNDALKALGNGVVPQQAAAATAAFLADIAEMTKAVAT